MIETHKLDKWCLKIKFYLKNKTSGRNLHSVTSVRLRSKTQRMKMYCICKIKDSFTKIHIEKWLAMEIITFLKPLMEIFVKIGKPFVIWSYKANPRSLKISFIN